MNTPICDFVKKYAKSISYRFHMPGHKGVNFTGAEPYDITEIDGADSLFHADGIIEESRKNACALFGAHTFYSTEGSSHAIRAMIYLTLKHAKEKNKSLKIVAGRNAHKSFISACAVSNVEVEWLYPKDGQNYLSCTINADTLKEYLDKTGETPCALYITSPDYLGGITELDELSKICKDRDILLLVDNAHGAYLKFLSESLHPIDHGADMCCDSAHKTLPCLTGGAYLHVNSKSKLTKNLPIFANDALSLFGSTSPSYLILQSLDYVNGILCNGGANDINEKAKAVASLKNKLIKKGFLFVGDEPLKITIKAKPLGYTGFTLNEYFKSFGIICEFYDNDHIVFMVSLATKKAHLKALESAILTLPIKKAILDNPPPLTPKKSAMRFNDAILSPAEKISVEKALGRIASNVSVSCPPAVPIVVCGEIIDENAIENFKYYKVKECNVVKT